MVGTLATTVAGHSTEVCFKCDRVATQYSRCGVAECGPSNGRYRLCYECVQLGCPGCGMEPFACSINTVSLVTNTARSETIQTSTVEKPIADHDADVDRPADTGFSNPMIMVRHLAAMQASPIHKYHGVILGVSQHQTLDSKQLFKAISGSDASKKDECDMNLYLYHMHKIGDISKTEDKPPRWCSNPDLANRHYRLWTESGFLTTDEHMELSYSDSTGRAGPLGNLFQKIMDKVLVPDLPFDLTQAVIDVGLLKDVLDGEISSLSFDPATNQVVLRDGVKENIGRLLLEIYPLMRDDPALQHLQS